MNKRKIKIYTKTGDKGSSSLYNLERRSKDDPIFEALGDTDELNAAIGVARQYCLQSNNGLNEKLIEIQSRLMDIGSAIATPISSEKSNESKKRHVHFAEENVSNLETWIDELDQSLPALRNFILPSGGFSSSHLHLARAVCRRCERHIIPLKRNDDITDSVAIYLNRLSDFLFVAARYAAHHEQKSEIVYQKERVKTYPKKESVADAENSNKTNNRNNHNMNKSSSNGTEQKQKDADCDII
eukprot:CAMPEP_0197037402 /NCGR_PEP_ID=MMETSP1384-20130603/14626_1 /TAXON_ID=29189 /ORGANISM="Ammonia sp." /LENGTH=241 /DNA_ID=CAMNT_0042467703 /DNA_START=104 /DNA_END=829 /DNA_ORIENTATION=+